MNDYNFTFSLKGQEYQLQLIANKDQPNQHMIQGQSAALKAIGLQPSSVMTVQDLHAKLTLCHATNVRQNELVERAVVQILHPHTALAQLAKIEKAILVFDPASPTGINTMPVEKLMEEYNVPGMSMAFYNDFDEASSCHKGYGTLRDDTQLLQAASVSKMVAALTVLSLVKEGLLTLEDDVAKHLAGCWAPNIPLDKAHTLTVRHLLAHTGGTTIGGYDGEEPGTHLTTDDIIKDVKLAREPDMNKHAYSGGGTMLLQKIIEVTCKDTFANVVKKRIFEPLGMKQSSYSPKEAGHKTVPGHGVHGDSIERSYPQLAAAGLYSTPHDLVKVVQAIQKAYDGDESIITQHDAHELLKLQTKNDHNGLGVFVDRFTNNNTVVFHHPGQNAGYQCIVVANTNKQGACIMTDSEFGKGLYKDVLRTIAKVCNWPAHEELPMCKYLATDKEVTKVTDIEAWEKHYSGTYECSTGTITVTKTHIQEPGCDACTIVHVGNPVCIFREFEKCPLDKFWFTEDDKGVITLHVFDREYQKKK